MKEIVIVVLFCLVIFQLVQNLRRQRHRVTPETNLLKWFSYVCDRYNDERLKNCLSTLSEEKKQSIKEFLALRQKTLRREIENESESHNLKWVARKEDSLFRVEQIKKVVDSLPD